MEDPQEPAEEPASEGRPLGEVFERLSPEATARLGAAVGKMLDGVQEQVAASGALHAVQEAAARLARESGAKRMLPAAAALADLELPHSKDLKVAKNPVHETNRRLEDIVEELRAANVALVASNQALAAAGAAAERRADAAEARQRRQHRWVVASGVAAVLALPVAVLALFL